MPWSAPIRKIIHVDMDAFFAAIEQRDHPEWQGKPLVVGGNRNRGVVAAASYEARKFGIHSAMPSKIAHRLCPNLIFASGKFEVYREASNKIMNIFREYTDLVESLSLDEAYIDVSTNKFGCQSATLIAKEIKQRIKEQTQLTASAGVSFNKFLAKIASDYKKPDGLYVIRPGQAEKFVDQLPVGKIPGIGKVTEEKMKRLSIYFGRDLKRVDKYFLNRNFGKAGLYYYDLIRFDNHNPVTPERVRKSLGAERTFDVDKTDEDDMLNALMDISAKIGKRLEKVDVMGKTLTLKIKYFDFVVQSRSKTVKHLIQSETEIFDIASELLLIPIKPIKPVRLLGIQMSNLNTEPDKRIARQMSLNFYGRRQSV